MVPPDPADAGSGGIRGIHVITTSPGGRLNMGIQDEIKKLVGTESAKHKRLIEYVVRQLRSGRDLTVVLEDPYVVNRLSPLDQLALLEEPEVVEAAGEAVLAEMRRHLASVAER
jgi:hypothetical protein